MAFLHNILIEVKTNSVAVKRKENMKERHLNMTHNYVRNLSMDSLISPFNPKKKR